MTSPKKRRKSAKEISVPVHKEILVKGFIGFFYSDPLCGFELWNGGLMTKSNAKVTCPNCLEKLPPRRERRRAKR